MNKYWSWITDIGDKSVRVGVSVLSFWWVQIWVLRFREDVFIEFGSSNTAIDDILLIVVEETTLVGDSGMKPPRLGQLCADFGRDYDDDEVYVLSSISSAE